MTYYEYTPEQEAKYERFVDQGFNSLEARTMSGATKVEELGHKALSTMVLKSEKPGVRHDHRGGRSYPEPSDSELDPYWNGEAAVEPVADNEASRVGFSSFAQEADGDAINSLIKAGFSPTEATARFKAKKEINHRS